MSGTGLSPVDVIWLSRKTRLCQGASNKAPWLCDKKQCQNMSESLPVGPMEMQKHVYPFCLDIFY